MIKPCQKDIDFSIRVRCQSKSGKGVTQEEQIRNRLIRDKYHEWYQATEPHIINETVPFGSTLHLPFDMGLLNE